MKTVVVGLSGGVDSSVAAYLLKKQGYNVIGLFMLNWEEKDENGYCTAEQDFEDVKRVANKIGIPYYTVNYAKEYQERVFKYFLEEYERGRTPNPDVLCNKEIKFGPFLKYALELGADYIATGHYARVEYSKEYNRYVIKKSNAGKKDQTYVLYSIPSELLSHIIFPLSEFSSKEEIRKMAQENGLITANKPDSQEICFVPNNDYVTFLERHNIQGMKYGKIVNTNGEVLGKHKGLHRYTIGQRRGMGISSATPLYVLKLDKEW